MTDHLSPAILNALADGELSADQLASTNRHLAECQSCTSKALHQSLLKSAAARAGLRYTAPASLQQSLARQVRLEASKRDAPQRPIPSSLLRGFWSYGWATACVLLLICVSIFVAQRVALRESMASSQYAALATEAIDQHIATLAANAPPQVTSSDRHTVKPWFSGKLPFSFNLPENLPSGITLEGANLTYIHNRPAAQLLYSIGKHRVSVYLQQNARGNASSALATERSGFHLLSFSTPDLEGIAVSDVDPVRLSDLVSLIVQAQMEAHQQSR